MTVITAKTTRRRYNNTLLGSVDAELTNEDLHLPALLSQEVAPDAAGGVYYRSNVINFA